MRPQTYPVRLSLPNCSTLENPDVRIGRITVGESVFTPPLDAFVGHSLSPREGNTILLSMLGFTQPQIGEQYGTSENTVNSQLDRAYAKLGIIGAFATSRVVLGLGAHATKADTVPHLTAEALSLVERLSFGEHIETIAQELSIVEGKEVTGNTLKQRINRIRQQNPGQSTRLIIARSFLSGQLHLPGLHIPGA